MPNSPHEPRVQVFMRVFVNTGVSRVIQVNKVITTSRPNDSKTGVCVCDHVQAEAAQGLRRARHCWVSGEVCIQAPRRLNLIHQGYFGRLR